MQHQEIILGRPDQAFHLDPPDGRPEGTPSVVVLGAGLRMPMTTTGECSIDPVETALHGDAIRGGTSIRVVDATGIRVGGRYLMTKPEGEREWITVVAIADHTLSLKHPLIHRYAGAATIRGARISIAIDPTWASNRAFLTESDRHRGLAGYMLRWSYVADGAEVTAVSFADLVTTPSSELVTPEDVARRNPGFLDNLPPEHRANQGADFIAEAFRAVRLEAVGDAHAQRKIRDDRVIRELVQARAQVIRLEDLVLHGEPRGDELAIAEQRYRNHYARLVQQPREATVKPTPAPEKSSSAKLAKGSEPGVRRIPKLTRY